MDVNNLLEYAINESKLIVKDEIFLVKDLFKGYEWKKIAKADRLWLGREFLNGVKNKKVKNIEIMEKTSSNKQVYKKKMTTNC